MPRETSQLNKKAKEWLKLGKQVQKVIETRGGWIAFKKYCDSYYPKCHSCWDTGIIIKWGKETQTSRRCPDCKPKK